MQNNASNNGLAFMKMHGAGNDFVILDSRGRDPVVTSELARVIGDRHHGVGFDQLAEIRSSNDADIQIDFWNADGSTAGACGNATRCIGQYLMAELGCQSIVIRTDRGLLAANLDENGMTHVNMGAPELEWGEIPLSRSEDTNHLPIDGDPAAVGMGNPHCVFFADNIEVIDVAELGARIEHHPLFPRATNVEFVQVRGDQDLRLRVWERGTGITLACGSGACAAVVASHRRGLTGRKVNVQVDGGNLTIDWRDDGVWMTGPVAHVFSGVLNSKFLGKSNG